MPPAISPAPAVALMLVMAGGAVGAGARHLASRGAIAAFGSTLPWGTLGVNVAGSLLMGLLVAALPRFDHAAESWRLALGTGVLGGFTTFSAFSLDLARMAEGGRPALALGYAALSVTAALAALAAGLALGRAW